MQRRITPMLLGSAMLLFLWTDIRAQSAPANLHETVIQGREAYANMPVEHHSQRRNIMPPTDQDKFGKYAGLVTIFKDYFSRIAPNAAAKGFDDRMNLSSYDWKQWTESDLRKLATTYNGVDAFAMLSDMKNAAFEKDANGNPTQDALWAQNVLTELKPDSCKSWKSFFNMIVRAEKATEDKRIPLMKSKNIPIPGTGALLDLTKFKDIAGDPMDVLDQQKALEQLDKNQVKMDSEHSLKSPDPKAIALDAVKAIKGAVRAA